MKSRIPAYILAAAATLTLLSSCSNTRFLSGDQLLYTGRKEVIVSDSGFFSEDDVRKISSPVTAFNPNGSLGGRRLMPPFGLWIHNYRKPAEGKKPGWLYRTFAREPVLISTVNPELRCRKLESELFSKGFFHAAVRSELDTSKRDNRKASVIYQIVPGRPFRYNEISFSTAEDPVDSIINSFSGDLAMKPADLFDLEKIRTETKRISEAVIEDGFFYFNQSYLKLTADTVSKPGSIDLMIGKDNTMYDRPARFTVRGVTVTVSGDGSDGTAMAATDTVISEGIRVVTSGMKFRPEIFSRAVYLRPGDTYSASGHRQTIAHLNSYGIFKFINIRYVAGQDTLSNTLDMLIDLSPMKDISLDLEANVVTKSTGFSGPGFSATLAQGNLGGGANRLQLRLDGGVEWQWGSTSQSTLGTTSYNIGLSSSIIFPRLIIPPSMLGSKRFNMPQTSVTLGFEFMNKIKYYRMSSVNLGFGYQWKQKERITHLFYPAFVNSIDLLKTTPEFDSIMNANPYIKKSFEEQFVVGMKYDFIFDNNLTTNPNGFFFQGGVSTSGNLIDLIKRAGGPEGERPYSLGPSVYSQFVKFTTDVRYAKNLPGKSLVFRFYAGLGVPYSNSLVMPYVEQFYSGGSNSLRAFIARSLGPGATATDSDAEIIDQTGDIRLEGNAEFRFGISKLLKGALFLEAGNVWLLNPDETRPEAEFSFDTFADQLAVGTGFGLRFDFSFFILRADVGLPLRTPYVRHGDSKWFTDPDDIFHDKVFNLAIGYPF